MNEIKSESLAEIEYLSQNLSPGTKKKKIDHIIRIRESNAENRWSCCCIKGTTDRRLIEYIGKYIITIGVLGFSFVQIVRAEECDSMLPFYSGLITFVIGYYIDSGSPKEKEHILPGSPRI